MSVSATRRKTVSFYAVSCVVSLVLFELGASAALQYAARFRDEPSARARVSYLSSVNLAHAIGVRFGLVASRPVREVRRDVEPRPFYVADRRLGYRPAAGRFRASFLRRTDPAARWDRLDTRVTINEDGTRWTGASHGLARPSIFVFGDSFVFGTGVSDEQTMAFVLQQAHPEYRVRLMAAGGYGLTQAYLQFMALRRTMTADDVVVIGYADFYGVRNVVAPSRLREIAAFGERVASPRSPFELPRATLSEDGRIEITWVQQLCALNAAYCDGPDPSSAEMTRVSAALLNEIIRRAPGAAYVLHIDGSPDDPVFGLLDDAAVVVSVLTSAFDGFVRDDVAGFDSHPGPYWHYAVGQRLADVIRQRGARDGP